MRASTLLLFLFVPLVFAEGPEFEAASIKAAPSTLGLAPGGGGPGTTDPTHVRWVGRIPGLTQVAFDLPSYQIEGAPVFGTQFEISALVPEKATKEQVNQMWRNLLLSRFGLKYHIEQREFAADELVVAPKGHKLKENNEPSDADLKTAHVEYDLKSGRYVMKDPGWSTAIGGTKNGVAVIMMGRAQPIQALVQSLTRELKHPVVDKTNLTGHYDYYVESVRPAPGVEALGLDLEGALQQELGLKLVRGKTKLDVVVIDKIQNMPTEN